jgi:UDP-N-acetylglucosamine 1-carboxyvinyltransferase
MHENVWDNRYQYIEDLKTMGARIMVADRFAIIDGPAALSGARVRARDLRAGAAMVLAGLSACGETRIDDIHIIERGYEDFVMKMRSLGADIEQADS